MRKVAWIFMAALILTCLPYTPASAWGDKEPTAIIIDNETGEPIEGAVALAQWVKYRPTLFEGGIPYAAKARETVADKEGKVYIKGYWTKNPFACERHLTVYKPGYALWNSEKEAVYPLEYQPKDFSSSNNVVRLVKFEKAAQEWKKIVSTEYKRKRPRALQFTFLMKCFESKLDTNVITMDEVFERYEDSLRTQENDQAWREHEKSKKK